MGEDPGRRATPDGASALHRISVYTDGALEGSELVVKTMPNYLGGKGS
ncbi:hypothetical protein [Pseudonocardia sp. H11422]|nr:hypothetical protein [Pseudonocardia sp. H11422]